MLNSIFLIISALLPVVVSKLEQFKTISPTTGDLITGITGAATAFAGTLSAGTDNSITATSILTAIDAALSVLKAELPSDGTASTVLVYIVAIEAAIASGLAATNIKSVDGANLQPVTAV